MSDYDDFLQAQIRGEPGAYLGKFDGGSFDGAEFSIEAPPFNGMRQMVVLMQVGQPDDDNPQWHVYNFGQFMDEHSAIRSRLLHLGTVDDLGGIIDPGPTK